MLKLILASCLFVACQSYTLLYPYTPVVVRLPPYVAQQPIISPVVIELPGEDEDGSGSGEEEPEYLKYECSKDGTFTVPGVNCSKYYVCNGGRVNISL